MSNVIHKTSFGGNIGSALGQGLGAGLDLLAQHKLNRMLEEKQVSRTAQFLKTWNPNLSDQQARSLASAPEYAQQEFFKQGFNVPQPYDQQIAQQGYQAPTQQSQLGNGINALTQQQQNPLQAQQQVQQSQPVQQTLQQEFQQPQKQQQKPAFTLGKQGEPKNAIDEYKQEQLKAKLLPEISYLDDVSNDVDSLLDLAQKGKVDFGISSSVLSQIPWGLGNFQLTGDTGLYNALANKFVTDAAQKAKGVRSVYHIKAIEASKAGLSRTKEQNIKILKHLKKELDQKKVQFYKDHPLLRREEASISNNQPEQPKQFRKNAAGQVQQWDPVSQSYKFVQQ